MNNKPTNQLTKKYKAIMLDVDGTLILNQKGAIPTRAVTSAINKASKVIHVCLATSRPYNYAKRILDHLELSGYSVINGGSQIIDAKTRKFIWEQPLLLDDIKAVTGILEKEDIVFWYNDGEKDIQAPASLYPKKVFQVYVGSDLTNAQADTLITKLSHIPTVIAQKVPSWTKGYFCIIITHAKATKQHGVFEVAKLLGIKTHDMIGVGDGYNDFPLLLSCGLKVAMGNAVPELKDIADYVAPTVEEDGVVNIINKFVL